MFSFRQFVYDSKDWYLTQDTGGIQMVYRRKGFAVINFLITLSENNDGF